VSPAAPDRPRPRPRWLLGLAVLAGAFGIATVISGGRVLFGPEAVRAAAGQVVPFVLWFNFLAGFAYLLAAAGLWGARRWAAPLSMGIAVATALVFLALGVHVLRGGAFENRTVAAMTLRTAVWAAIAVAARRRLSSENRPDR
jgi:MYXO-CTERM domain-containing protein